MATTLKANLIKIGNSQGIRIPKAVIQQCHLTDEIEIEVRDNQLIIKAARHPRAGWDEEFEKAANQVSSDDLQEWQNLPVNEDVDWTWK